MNKHVANESLFYNEDIQSRPPNVSRSDPNEVGAEASGNQAPPPNVTSQRPSSTFASTRPGAERVNGPDYTGLEEDEEQMTVFSSEASTIHVIAQAVDTEEEERRLHEQERIRHERDQAVRERDQLRQIVYNAVGVPPVAIQNTIVPEVIPVVPPNTDGEDGDENENIHPNDGDLPESDDHKWVTEGRCWFAFGVIFLIVVAVTVSLALVLPSVSPVPTTPEAFLNDLLSSVSSDGGEALSTPATPQNSAFNWMMTTHKNLTSYSNATIIQQYALATLFHSANGTSWDNRTLWLDNNEECSGWHGIDCTKTTTGAVSKLILQSNNLKGKIPPEIGLLTQLDLLRLSENTLAGPIPTEIGLLISLNTLFLGGNTLTGTIPTEIGLLTELELLSLYNNRLMGTVPTEMNRLVNLDSLYLYDNLFTGSYTCPDFIDTTCLISCDDFTNETCHSL